MAEKSLSATTSLAAAIMSPTPSTSKAANNVARIQRNVAEKQRRDKLNGYISELANIVPMVSMSSKRLDKTSILRLSAAHLRITKSALGGNRKSKKGFKWCPSFLTNEQARDILESVDGFLIVTTSAGKILFTSRSVERYLGHQDIEMIGHSLFIFIHPHDVDAVKDEIERLLLACLEDGSSHRCSFRCRIKEKAQPRSEVITYQYVQFVGNMTVCEEENRDLTSTKSVVNHMFKAFVKLVDANPYNQLSLEEATADEYVTRHSLDGTIIFADHRLATITGHMPHEVMGLSAYEYIHSGDTSIALFAHHLMFSNDKGTGMIVYRLRTRDDRYVYLKSVGCLQFDKATTQVDHFVCVNQQLNEADGDAQLRYFVDRYIPHIKGSSATTLFESVKALQTSSVKPSITNKVNKNLDFAVIPFRTPSVESKMITEPVIDQGKGLKDDCKGNVLHKLNDSAVNTLSEGNDHVTKSKNAIFVSHLNESMINNIENCTPTLNISPSPTESNTSSKLSSSSIQIDAKTTADKMKICGTNAAAENTSISCPENVSTNDSMTNFVSTLYISKGYSSNSDDMLSLQTPVLPTMNLDSTYMINKYLADHASKNSDVDALAIETSFHNRNDMEVFSHDSSVDIALLNSACPQNGLLQIDRTEVNGTKILSKSNGFVSDAYESPINSVRSNADGSPDVYGSKPNKTYRMYKKAYDTDSNSSFGADFPICSEDPIIGNVSYGNGQAVVKHSPIDDSFRYLDSPHSKLSISNSDDTDSYLKNSLLPVKNDFRADCELKDEASSSFMDYYDVSMHTSYGTELKDSSSIQDNFPSLNSTLQHDDINSLPSANVWNDIYSSTNSRKEQEKRTHLAFM